MTGHRISSLPLAERCPPSTPALPEREAHKDPVHIGDVMVCVAGIENPYTGHSINGADRVSLLTNFYLGCLSADFEVWHAPACGGARKLEGPHEVNWQASRIGG